MIRKLLFTTILLFTTCIITFAGSLHGVITNEKNATIINSSVILHKYSDSSIVSTDITNDKGYYEFKNIDTGSYYIVASHVGKESYVSSKIICTKNSETYTQDAMLADTKKALKEVKVLAKKPLIQVMADKTVFNVEQSINTIGNNALELLQKSPGVVIDKDENVILKGKSSVKIYINGKPSVLEQKDLASYLKSMNANDIEAIEIISNPGARYEAEGGGGIINIKLKKNKKLGTNGSFNIGAQAYKYFGADAGLVLNHRGKKSNIYGSYSWGYGKTEQEIILDRTQNNINFENTSVHTTNEKAYNFKTGIDYTLNNKNTIGAEVNAGYSNFPWLSNGKTVIGKDKLHTDSVLIANNNLINKNLNVNTNVNYRYADSAENTLGIDLDNGMFNSDGTSFQPNYYKTPDEKVILKENIFRNNTPIRIQVNSVKVDAEKRVGKGKLGFGAKTSFVTTKNTFNFYDVLSNIDVLNKSRSNKFTYKENINALYTNYSRALSKKINMNAGLRMENTNSNGTLTPFATNIDSTVKRQYTNLFPSAGLAYTYNANHMFSFNYSRRIDRPSYQDLNPFENKIDELTYEKGNAYLRPQFSNNIEINHTYKYFLNTSLSFSHTKDKFMQTTDTTEFNRTYVTNKNFGSEDVVSLNVSCPIPIKKWWFLYMALNSNYTLLKADFEGRKLHTSYVTYSGYAENTISLPKEYKLSISGFFTGPTVWGGTFRTKPFGAMEVGMQKSFLQKKMTVKASISDILRSNIISAQSSFAGLQAIFHRQSTSRQFKVNVSYRFGNNNVKAREEKQLGADEMKRIKKGK